MHHFVVSARKYRPSKYSEVVGQQPITTTLRNAVISGHIAQAYLFCGPRGVGKTTIARILAKAINCSNPDKDGEPCNQCESCHSFQENRSYNIHELDAASNNKVEDIKSLIDQVRIPPQVGRYSVYIIDEVHMLSAQAFNAFLKTLEEPPDYAVFILATTEKQKIIPTILSRCQIYDFQRIKIDDIIRHLQYVAGAEKVDVEESALHIIAQKADGSLRDALSAFDQLVSFSGNNLTYEKVIENLNVLDYEYYFTLTHQLCQGDFGEAVQLLDQILVKGFDIRDILTGLARHFRELLMARDKNTIPLMEVGKAMREKYLRQASEVEEAFLIQALEMCYQADITLRNSHNQRLHAEILLLQLCGLKKKPSRIEDKQSPDKQAAEKTEKERSKKDPSVKTAPAPVADNVQKEPALQESEEPEKKAEQGTSGNKKKGPANQGDTTEAPNTGQPGKEKSKEEDEAEDKSLSIKVLLNGLNNGGGGEKKAASAVAEEDRDYTQEDQEITAEDLTRSWLNFADKLKADRPRFSSALRTHLPQFNPPATIELEFENKNLKEDFERNLKSELQDYLIHELKNRMIHFDIRLEKGETRKKKPYTPEEKYERLKAKNPDIEKLRRQFNLDFD